MTATRIDPYDRRVITETVARAVRAGTVIGEFAPQAAGLTKRRAVDLCRMSACLCPS